MSVKQGSHSGPCFDMDIYTWQIADIALYGHSTNMDRLGHCPLHRKSVDCS